MADHRAARGGRAPARPSAARTAQPRRAGGKPADKKRVKDAPAPARARARSKAKRPPAEPDGPHGRLGFVWALGTIAVVLLGVVPIAAWMAVHAGLGAMQAARTHKRSAKGDAAPHPVAAAAAAAIIPVGCTAGLPGAVAALVVAVGGAVLIPTFMPAGRTDVVRTATIAVLLGGAGGSLVLARGLGAMPGLFLLFLAAAHDAGAYLIGTGASNRWEGPAAGVLAMIPVTLGAAAFTVPPFTEAGPFVLGALAAVLTPLGPGVASTLLLGRGKGIRVPAVRRLDSLVLLGPVWAVAAAALS